MLFSTELKGGQYPHIGIGYQFNVGSTWKLQNAQYL